MIDNKRACVFAVVVGLGAVLALPPPAIAALSANQVKAKVAKEFGVKVLKVRPGKADGRKVFVVTVMNPGGDFNEAFQVSTIVVDVETGKLVSGFRHRASGLDANQAPTFVPNLHSPDTLSWGFIWR
ncbi:MAG: PepSY domain-containing protein [Proteobacteria bacterium]|nr:PepSY domain-containing protein [Pseudomonadota bacterium]